MISTLFLIIIVVAAAALLWREVRIGRRRHERTNREERTWDDALAEAEPVERALMSMGRTLADVPVLRRQAASPVYEYLRRKLVAGGTYSGSVEVFMATQFAAMLFGAVLILTAIIIGHVFWLAVLTTAGVLVAYVPMHRVRKALNTRAKAVSAGLPEFAEAIMLPLAAGRTSLASMEYIGTALPNNPVAVEAKRAAQKVQSRNLSEDEAFSLASDHLGTPAARALFATLLRGVRDGVPIRDQLGAQARTLREAEFQRQRAENKKLPTKLILKSFIHFVPLLFASILVPVMLRLTGVV